MTPGHSGGLEVAAYCFAERLLAREDVTSGAVRLTLIVPWELTDRFRAAVPPEVTLLSLDSPKSDLLRVIRGLTRSRFGHTLRAQDYDVVYTMNGRLPPEGLGIATVVLVADLQHLVYPAFFDARERELRAAASTAVARSAHHIVTISEFSRQKIMSLLGVEGSRVSCSYLAADPAFDRRPSAAERDRVLARHGLAGERYLLLPAQVWPHKNHETVIEALGKLLAAGREVPLLVSTGANASPFARDLMERVSRSAVGSRVRFLGLCPHEELPALYAGADALVFCSLYEGFGMPLLEAMRMDCPVIASTTTSVPEVSGDAAVLVDPTDADAIASAIVRVSGDHSLRSQLVAKGRARAETFSWDRHCNEMVRTLLACCGRTVEVASAPHGSVDLRDVKIEPSLATGFRTVTYPRLRRRLIGALQTTRRG